MKNRVLFGMTALIMLVCCLSVCAPAVQAAEGGKSVTATIPVQVTDSGYELVEDHVIKLEAVTAGAAMPEHAELTIKGSGTGAFEIECTKLGIYDYKVSQTKGTSERGIYDETVYNVRVTVTNNEDYSDFDVAVIAFVESAENKGEIGFENEYTANLTVKKVWSNDEKAQRPTSVTVNLIQDTTVVKSVKLSADNSWTYTWTGLDADYKWSVAEVVPTGYKASYAISGETTTITNTYSLIQTGQMNWPIIVFSAIGVLFLGFGAALLSRKKEIDA